MIKRFYANYVEQIGTVLRYTAGAFSLVAGWSYWHSRYADALFAILLCIYVEQLAIDAKIQK